MSHLPYNPNAGNGITDVGELYNYMMTHPLCVLDRNFMESYGRILCRRPWETHACYTIAWRAVQTTRGDDLKQMGLEITDEYIKERAFQFNEYLQRFREYDKEGCTEDADRNTIIHVLNGPNGGWGQTLKNKTL